MFPSPFGGVLIDTLGMRELGAESTDLSKTFDDIEELARGCKFTICTHTTEPGCSILKALADGILEQRRLNSYLKLKTEVGGMKNMRKFAKEKRKQK